MPEPPFGETIMLGGPQDGRPLAYRGKKGCHWPTCTRLNTITDACYGWHCAHCHEPCSSQGHTCKEVAE